MSFGAARLATEKAVFRPALLLSILPGITEMQMGVKRKTLSKKTRFEVFKRDSFKCQYCGASSPEAVLVVDHIDPISKNGADEMVNYITACQPCNAGKSDRKLDDNTTLAKQKAQLDELNERREQLEMMLQWRSGMKDIQESQIDAAKEAWSEVAKGWSLNDTGEAELRKHIKTFGLNAVLDAIETAADKYLKYGEDENATQESVGIAWSKVGGIARMVTLPEDKRDLYYIKGILKNRLSYVPFDVFRFLENAVADGVQIEDIKSEAKHTRNWTNFSTWLVEAREAARGEG